MKRTLFAAVLLVGLMSASVAYAANPWDWTLQLHDVNGDPYNYQFSNDMGNESSYMLVLDGVNKVPHWTRTSDDGLTIDGTGQLKINSFDIDQVDGLTAALAGKASSVHGHVASDIEDFDSEVLTVAESYIDSHTFLNNVHATTTVSHLMFATTTSSGHAIVYLTASGTSGGFGLCHTLGHIDVTVNDPNNTFGTGYTLTNSNKTLDVAVNTRSFSATTILGISVLGSSAVSAATNGTPVQISVDCTS